MRTNLMLGCAAVALITPAAAFAQSTGSAEADNVEVVVTGAREAGVGGIDVPDTSKNKQVLNQSFISRQTPGQTINDIINQLPGVSFQNNDPFGSAGGTLTIRGFDGSRISQTFDGIPLNDTGNYAIFSNQQLDPELIEQVNVNLGSTDPDSPTASASGSTVNYRTLVPTDQFGARLIGSVGDYNFFRVFGVVNTGVFTSFGTKAWFAASSATNDVVFNNFGKIDKQQYNAKIYQPIGSGRDFISISGHYNQNRNNFFGSAPLRDDNNVFSQNTTTGGATPGNPTFVTGAARTVGTNATNRFPRNRDELPYSVARCQIDVAQPGVADTLALVTAPGATNNGLACGSTFDERYNPSNTGNIRVNSRFSLGDKLTLFVDPSYQYVKANGGGTVTGREGGFTRTTGVPITTPQYGFLGGSYYYGKDLNGDGDVLDQVILLAPSQTQTHRYGVISSLRYEFSDSQSIRVGYTLDYGRHRQTGETGFLQANGVPFDVFPVNDPIAATNGGVVQKRNRLSKAILNQGFGQYIGNFFEDKLRIEASLTSKWFKRDLNNFCFVTAANGNVDCLATPAQNAAYAAANPYVVTGTAAAPVVTGFAVPQQRTYKYHKLLPAGGFTYSVDAFQVFGNYSKGIQVPGTDNLYQAFFYPQNTSPANPTPETTDNFDAGLRYSSGRIQASVGPWYTRFQNRLASAFDVDTQQTIYRNLGRVDKYGVDASFAYRPINELLLYVYGSYLKSKIKTDVEIGRCPAVLTAANTTNNCTVAGASILAQTSGKRESGAPVYTVGGRIQATLGPLELGGQIKRTGRRYINDQNLASFGCTAALVNTVCPTTANTPATFTGTRGFQYLTYGPVAQGYTIVDFDARLGLDWAGIGNNNKTYLQFNVVNAFNKFYVGGFTGGQTVQFNQPFVQIGSPRAFIVSLNVGI